MGSLDGRRILITGASSGIGEATARTCAARGAQIACLARRTDLLERLADDVGGIAVAAEGFVRTPFGEDGVDEARLERFRERKEALGLDPDRVAATIAHALAEPPDVELIEIALTSTAQES